MKLQLTREELEDLDLQIEDTAASQRSVLDPSRDLQAVLETTRELTEDGAVTKSRIRDEVDLDVESSEYLTSLLKVLQHHELVNTKGRGGGWEAVFYSDSARVEAIANAIAKLGYDGIAQFDKHEPEYETFSRLHEEYGNKKYLAVLGICAGTVDYQLSGNAQGFWSQLENATRDHGRVETIDDVRTILMTFLEMDVNARLREQKRGRLEKLFEREFCEWVVANYDDIDPIEIWEQLADVLDTTPEKKTIVFAVKVFDIIQYLVTGEYLELPSEVPIPCDLQVERVARTSGLVTGGTENTIIDAWNDVAERVTEKVGREVSILRIDSIVWQSGQIIGTSTPDAEQCLEELVAHYEDLGIDTDRARELATQLTYNL